MGSKLAIKVDSSLPDGCFQQKTMKCYALRFFAAGITQAVVAQLPREERMVAVMS